MARVLKNVQFDSTFTGRDKMCLMKCQINNKVEVVPLKNVIHNIKTNNDIAQIEVVLCYKNDFKQKLLESNFNFAISSYACFDDFEAKIGDKIVKGEIKEKEQAKKEYDEGIKQGKTMAMSTVDPELKDVIQVKLGNIEPKESIEIKLRYLESLQNYQHFYELQLPFAITERYSPSGTPQNYIDSCKFTDQKLYDWQVNVELNSNSNISNLDCSSHNFKIHYVTNSIKVDSLTTNSNSLDKIQGKQVKFSMKMDKPNKDFVLRFKLEEKINFLLQKRDRDDELNKYCAMLSIKNDFMSAEMVKNTNNPQEFIFLLDRSGSMSGNRIEMAKQSLIEILKILPSNSYFNIISYGSDYDQLNKFPIRANVKNIKDTIEQVEKMSANYGGTEIYDPLQYVYEKLNFIQGYARNIFILTDGDVGNGREIVDLVKQNSQQACLYSLGIGSGTSQVLITEMSTKGNGKYEFVKDNKNISKKMKNLLDYSLSKKFTNFKLNYDSQVVKAVVPDINNFTYIRENETLQCYFLLEDGFKETDIQLEVNGQPAYKTTIMENEYQNSDYLHKMANFRLIKKYLENTLCKTDVYDDIYIQKQIEMESLKEEALNLSLKYQILCELTAFISEIKNIKDEIQQQNLESQQVQVPNIKSSDYNSMNDQVNQMVSQYINYSQAPQSRQQDVIYCPETIKLSSKSCSYSQKSKKAGCCDAGGDAIDLNEANKSIPIFNNINSKLYRDQTIVSKQKQSNLNDTSQDISYLQIIRNQHPRGFWNCDNSNLKLLNISQKQFINFVEELLRQTGYSNIQLNLVLSILVLETLETKQREFYHNWQLSAKKCQRWLNEQQDYSDKLNTHVKLILKKQVE